MTIDYRPATDAEIVAAHEGDIRRGWPVRFRHFVRESYHPGASNGVSHRQYGRAKLRVQDGVPFVHHHGRLQRVTATAFNGPVHGALVLIDLRLASEHLPEFPS